MCVVPQPSDVYLVDANTSMRIPPTLAAVHINGASRPIPPMHPSSGSTGWLGLPLVFSYVQLCCPVPLVWGVGVGVGWGRAVGSCCCHLGVAERLCVVMLPAARVTLASARNTYWLLPLSPVPHSHPHPQLLPHHIVPPLPLLSPNTATSRTCQTTDWRTSASLWRLMASHPRCRPPWCPSLTHPALAPALD